MTIPAWPETTERTPPRRRASGRKFDSTIGDTTKAIEKQMSRLDPDSWEAHIGNGHTKKNGLPLHNANPDDPGVVIKWRDGEDTRAIGVDGYNSLAANLREAFLWIKETRMRNDRRVTTAGADFAAAALPSGEDDDASDITLTQNEAEEVLGVDVTAPDAAIKASFNEQVKDAHADTGGTSSQRRVQRLKQARDMLLEA